MLSSHPHLLWLKTHTQSAIHVLESDALYPILFQKHQGFPACGQPTSKNCTGAQYGHHTSTSSLIPLQKKQPRKSDKVRRQNILSSLHEAVSSVQLHLKDKLINNPILYCCAPPRTPLITMQHFSYITKSHRAAIGKAGFKEQCHPAKHSLLLHVTAGWCLTIPRLPGPHSKLGRTYVLVSVKTQS